MIPEHASHMVRRKRHCCRRALYTKKVRREPIRELCCSYQKTTKISNKRIFAFLIKQNKKLKIRKSLFFLTKQLQINNKIIFDF